MDFVPPEFADEAYGNYPLPIGFGQTISQPLTVAFMLELLAPRVGENILDVGSGSGWQTALLAHVASGPSTSFPADGKSSAGQGQVTAIERIPELKIMTERNAEKYNFIKRGVVRVILGDGSKGYAPDSPYDKIIAAAAGEIIPQAWKDQLRAGGRIVAPIKESVVVLTKRPRGDFRMREYHGFSFVPLVED